MKNSLLRQLKKRRIALGFKQKDMKLRVGISRQQYQLLESKGNPRLDTLSLIAKGLNSELMLIPKEKLAEVKALLESKTSNSSLKESEKNLSEDPWENLFEDDK